MIGNMMGGEAKRDKKIIKRAEAFTMAIKTILKQPEKKCPEGPR